MSPPSKCALAVALGVLLASAGALSMPPVLPASMLGADVVEVVAVSPMDDVPSGRTHWPYIGVPDSSPFGRYPPHPAPSDGTNKILLDLVLGLRDQVNFLQSRQEQLTELVKCSCSNATNCSVAKSIDQSYHPQSLPFHGASNYPFYGFPSFGGSFSPFGGSHGFSGFPSFPSNSPFTSSFPGAFPSFGGGWGAPSHPVFPGLKPPSGGPGGSSTNFVSSSSVVGPDGEVHGTVVHGTGDGPPTVTHFTNKPSDAASSSATPQPQAQEPPQEPAQTPDAAEEAKTEAKTEAA